MNAEGKDRNRPSLRFGQSCKSLPGIIDREAIFAQGRDQFVITVDRLYLSLQWQARRELFKPPCSQQRGSSFFKARSNSGMMGVIPNWNLHQLLFRKDARWATFVRGTT
jgi:hypothetical protein